MARRKYGGLHFRSSKPFISIMRSFISLCLLAASVSARSVRDMQNWQSSWHLPGRDWQHVPQMGNATFKQLIDHSDPSLGTFEQFYFYDTTYWKGAGSPVVLFTPGEVNATGYTSYLTTNRTTGVIAQEIGGAAIVIEHRYWGTSTPYTNLTTENMKYLTLENSIKDLTNFANNARLPFVHGRASSNAAAVPWVLVGGSYSGALTAWVESVAPGTFWAYYASSAVVEAISDFWRYFVPVQQGMPANCSADVSKVIDYMDNVLETGTADEVTALKTQFGLETVEHHDDFMAALENGPWLWQGNQLYRTTGFFTWCDYIENVSPAQTNNATNVALPSSSGVGLDKALAGYAQWMREELLPGYCEGYGYADFAGENNTACLNSYSATSPLYTDTSLSNAVDRQWVWMTCNEPFGYWQDGAPEGTPTIVSRLITPEYYIRMCGLYFPTAPDGTKYGIAAGRTEEQVNAYTDGWNTRNSSRLVYVNGGTDPWREATVSAESRPGGPLQSTAQVPVNLVPGGFHTSDLVTQNGAVNAGAKKVIDESVAQIVAWVNEFPKGWHHWSA
ncbi:hypothetical protein LTR95_004273 [Oleoguttula sp. CCFEE 5521]